jgi:thioredoxin reductase
MNKEETYDAIIVGGSYAGLSAAMALGRSLRRVLIIDGGKPCNRYAPHSHNFLTRDGQKPGDIAMLGRKDVQQYKTVRFYEGVATKVNKEQNAFTVQTTSGDGFIGTKLILATGIRDIMPAIKGFGECWGKSVIHCPYCHGYEYAGEATAILGNGDIGYHYAQLISNLTKDLIIFTNGLSTFTNEQLSKIKKHNIDIIESEIESIHHKEGQVEAVQTKDGLFFPVRAIYNRPDYVQHSDIPMALGCELTDAGLIKVDESMKTTVPDVFACGDNSSFRAVATAVYTGMLAGAMVNMELVKEAF